MSPETKTSEEANENGGVVNGASRFSEDDMDTEIEVTVGEVNEEKPRRKKKKKSSNPEAEEESNGEPRETSEERRERRRKKKEKKRAKEAKLAEVTPPPPPYVENVEEQKPSAKGKRGKMKDNISNLLDTPMLFAVGIFVCIIMPFSIYACDVIIGVNVIGIEEYKHAVFNEEVNDFKLLPNTEQLIKKKYTVGNSIYYAVQSNTNLNVKRDRRALPDEIGNETSIETEAEKIDIKATAASIAVTTGSGAKEESAATTAYILKIKTLVTNPPVPSEEVTKTLPSLETNTTTSRPRNGSRRIKYKPPKWRPPIKYNTTTTETPKTTTINQSLWMQQEGEFCKGLYYFAELHVDYFNETGTDWMDDQVYSVYQKEQALFFMFTVFGFLFLLGSLALRCDIFLNDEWSSFIMVNFILYSISMALTASVFSQESSNNGLRCATCRFMSNCSDINPWDYTNHWPAEDAWSLVAIVSFFLKLVDCYTIAIVTLKFVLDVQRDLWWVSFLKLFGWLLLFPILIFTPMLGVIRYQVIPGMSLHDTSALLAVESLFYIGIAFWALCLVALPFFCRSRMCTKSEEDWEPDEDEEY